MSPHRWFLSAQRAKDGRALYHLRLKRFASCPCHISFPFHLLTLTRLVKKSGGLEKACVPRHAVGDENKHRARAKHWGTVYTPAMTSGLTDHLWSFGELLGYKVAPAPWVEPKRRGRLPNPTRSHAIQTTRQSRPLCSRPLVRLRKGVLCSTTG